MLYFLSYEVYKHGVLHSKSDGLVDIKEDIDIDYLTTLKEHLRSNSEQYNSDEFEIAITSFNRI